jgi:hypothetical protein
MARLANHTERFALLLCADVKLVEADEVLRRAGLAKGRAQIAALRISVAREMQTLQNGVYERLVPPAPQTHAH